MPAVMALYAIAACARTSAPDLSAPDLDVILAEAPAATLAEYGLFADTAGRTPAPGVVAYDLINPLFSDHTQKHRFVYIPAGQSADYTEADVLAFPIGTVLVKTFAYGERYLETRLLIHETDGWDARPYVWNVAQTEAVYAPIGKRIEMAAAVAQESAPAFTYAVPNKNQCKTCHQDGDAVSPIGPKVRNLNHQGPYQVNQISDWVARGLLEGAPANPPQMAKAFDDTAPLDAQARAYLDINCAHCHKASGSASNSGLWLEWETDDPIKWGVGKHPTAAGRGAGDALVVIAPGNPDASILAYRMASNEAGIAMPELGRALVHAEGAALIEAWISGMDTVE
ncbi:MAG: SO2930 family diheme c-type cytochrome [Pseudomonadota bacterium]